MVYLRKTELAASKASSQPYESPGHVRIRAAAETHQSTTAASKSQISTANKNPPSRDDLMSNTFYIRLSEVSEQRARGADIGSGLRHSPSASPPPSSLQSDSKPKPFKTKHAKKGSAGPALNGNPGGDGSFQQHVSSIVNEQLIQKYGGKKKQFAPAVIMLSGTGAPGADVPAPHYTPAMQGQMIKTSGKKSHHGTISVGKNQPDASGRFHSVGKPHNMNKIQLDN